MSEAKSENEVERRVLRVLADFYDLTSKPITVETRFIGDLGFDSLDTVELTMELEDEFAIETSDEEVEKLLTVADAISLIEKKIGGAA